MIKSRKKFDDTPINEASYKWLEPEMLEQAFKERFEHPDCNAGVVIDDLRCDYYSDEAKGMEVFLKTLSEQEVYLVLLEE